MSLLEVSDLQARHGLLQAVRGVSFSIEQGETIALVGANGAGKSTMLRTIVGAHPASGGSIRLDGADITGVPAHRRVGLGMALVPEGRKLFADMTVEENLMVAGRRARRGEWTVDSVLAAFPMLVPLRNKKASQLSGGQQQAAVP
jgi:branched-chain amino acid transport system ATP-binding protein